MQEEGQLTATDLPINKFLAIEERQQEINQAMLEQLQLLKNPNSRGRGADRATYSDER